MGEKTKRMNLDKSLTTSSALRVWASVAMDGRDPSGFLDDRPRDIRTGVRT